MTRKKKTRSLKRIHNVKTGNISKFKKDADNDRQSVRLKGRKKTKSVYQKFLDENPDIAQQEKQNQLEQQAKAASQKPVQNPDTEEPKQQKADNSESDKKDLLSQLDDKKFDNDIY